MNEDETLKVLWYGVYTPTNLISYPGFTKGKEYPILKEVTMTGPANNFHPYGRVTYSVQTINDAGKKVHVPERLFSMVPKLVQWGIDENIEVPVLRKDNDKSEKFDSGSEAFFCNDRQCREMNVLAGTQPEFSESVNNLINRLHDSILAGRERIEDEQNKVKDKEYELTALLHELGYGNIQFKDGKLYATTKYGCFTSWPRRF